MAECFSRFKDTNRPQRRYPYFNSFYCTSIFDHSRPHPLVNDPPSYFNPLFYSSLNNEENSNKTENVNEVKEDGEPVDSTENHYNQNFQVEQVMSNPFTINFPSSKSQKDLDNILNQFEVSVIEQQSLELFFSTNTYIEPTSIIPVTTKKIIKNEHITQSNTTTTTTTESNLSQN